LIAISAALLLHAAHFLPEAMMGWVAFNLVNALKVNVILAIFNLLPLPPLDGGRIAVGLLPHPFSAMLARLERAGFAILIFGLFILPWIGGKIGLNLDVLRVLVLVPSQYVIDFIVTIAGIR
jgi:Zn-dependent protease